MLLSSHDRIALLMHEGTQNPGGKTGLAILRYSKLPIAAVIDYACAGAELSALTGIQRSVPIVNSVEAALDYQPTVLLIGIAPSGGLLPEPWLKEIEVGLKAGLNLVNGLHHPLSQIPAFEQLLQENQWIWDVRQEPPGLSVGTGQAATLSCKRVLSVGTDMSVGKMSTNLELHNACLSRGLRSKVIATGQTNLMLGDDGVALDAVRVDFASGAVEQQVMRHGPNHEILFIEGQGSMFNPASTATLPLLRGSQPTHLILVHRAGQTHIRNFPQVKIPSLQFVVDFYQTVAAAGGAFREPKVVGIALNTGHLSQTEADAAIAAAKDETQLPCTDVIRYGAEPLIKPILES
ncbi:DUF1611 domain-containing protein [filamentous cyanobacterium CCP5]|nr:DUF1611 domain-containing protein [filamentous cyanobacterium CCP5]